MDFTDNSSVFYLKT